MIGIVLIIGFVSKWFLWKNQVRPGEMFCHCLDAASPCLKNWGSDAGAASSPRPISLSSLVLASKSICLASCQVSFRCTLQEPPVSDSQTSCCPQMPPGFCFTFPGSVCSLFSGSLLQHDAQRIRAAFELQVHSIVFPFSCDLLWLSIALPSY